MILPNDPVILLSYINTQLRDFYPSLDDFCISADLEKASICAALETIDYQYDPITNQFV